MPRSVSHKQKKVLEMSRKGHNHRCFFFFFLSISGTTYIENRLIFAQEPEMHVHKRGEFDYVHAVNYAVTIYTFCRNS